jgi:hypothetical protein
MNCRSSDESASSSRLGGRAELMVGDQIRNANHGLNEPGADARRSIFSLTAPRQTENSRSEVLSPPQRTMQGPRSVAIHGMAKPFC